MITPFSTSPNLTPTQAYNLPVADMFDRLDSTDGIIAGHGRLLAARNLGLTEVPVVVLGHLTEIQRRAYIIADNQLALNAGWNDELLRGALQSLDVDGFNLSLVGFSDEDLVAILAGAEPEAADDIEEDRVAIAHATLHAGDLCPECRRGKVYRQKEPATLVRFVGHAPLEATVFELERLRCNACQQVFTAEEPETAGPDKYDETALAMIALLKYGTGVPFKRLERLQEHLGMPLPATTQ